MMHGQSTEFGQLIQPAGTASRQQHSRLEWVMYTAGLLYRVLPCVPAVLQLAVSAG